MNSPQIEIIVSMSTKKIPISLIQRMIWRSENTNSHKFSQTQLLSTGPWFSICRIVSSDPISLSECYTLNSYIYIDIAFSPTRYIW